MYLKNGPQTPSPRTISQMSFQNFTDDITTNGWNVYGVEVYEKGLLTHTYGDVDDGIYDIYSATKSVLSIAFGIAYDRGLVDLQKSVLEYLPKNKVNEMSDVRRRAFSEITLHRLLTMSVGGFPFRAEGDSFLDFSLGCEIDNPQEKVFNYNNINAYLIGVALTEILGEDLGKFIEREIFAPLDITHFDYSRSPEGYFYGASGMKMSVHDLSKFGILISNGGVYNGHRIISEEYTRMATSVQQMNREGGYGYFFWKYKDGFSINGKWGQKCYVLPERKMIITFLSHIEEDTLMLRESMERNIL